MKKILLNDTGSAGFNSDECRMLIIGCATLNQGVFLDEKVAGCNFLFILFSADSDSFIFASDQTVVGHTVTGAINTYSCVTISYPVVFDDTAYSCLYVDRAASAVFYQIPPDLRITAFNNYAIGSTISYGVEFYNMAIGVGSGIAGSDQNRKTVVREVIAAQYMIY